MANVFFRIAIMARWGHSFMLWPLSLARTAISFHILRQLLTPCHIFQWLSYILSSCQRGSSCSWDNMDDIKHQYNQFDDRNDPYCLDGKLIGTEYDKVALSWISEYIYVLLWIGIWWKVNIDIFSGGMAGLDRYTIESAHNVLRRQDNIGSIVRTLSTYSAK